MANTDFITLVFSVKRLTGAPLRSIKIEYHDRPFLYDIWVLSLGQNRLINCLVESVVVIPNSDTILIDAQEIRRTPPTLELWVGGAK